MHAPVAEMETVRQAVAVEPLVTSPVESERQVEWQHRPASRAWAAERTLFLTLDIRCELAFRYPNPRSMTQWLHAEELNRLMPRPVSLEGVILTSNARS